MHILLPLVSIVIPFYNQNEIFLQECLLSALLQTYPNIEVIASDNHSNNGCGRVALALASNYTQLRIVRPKSHLSMCAHFSFAVAQSSGEYISFLCSDDIFDLDHVTRLINPLTMHEDISIACSLPFQGFQPNSARPESNITSGLYSSHDFAYLAQISHICSLGAAIFRKDCFLSVGGLNPELHYAFDVDLLFKLIFLGNVYFDSIPTAFIRLWDRPDQQNRHNSHIVDMTLIFDSLLSQRFPLSLHSALEKRQLGLLTIPLLKLVLFNGPLHLNFSSVLIDKIVSITPLALDRFVFMNRSPVMTRLVSILALIAHKLFST